VGVFKLTLLEPLIVTSGYSTGGFYRSPDYVPSTSIAGAVLAHLIKGGLIQPDSGMYSKFVPTHAYPCDAQCFEELRRDTTKPLPLPLATLARKKEDGSIVSTALLLAGSIASCDVKAAERLRGLHKKVGRVFVYPCGSGVCYTRPYGKKTVTHVPLAYETRSGAWAVPGERGLIYSVEVIDVPEEGDPPTFAFKAVYDESLSPLGSGIEVKIGSHKKKGYGQALVELVAAEDADAYRRKRADALEKALGEASGFLTVDAVTHVREGVLGQVGELVYAKVSKTTVKHWVTDDFTAGTGHFRISHGANTPGSVWVYKIEESDGAELRSRIERLVGLELAQVGPRPPDEVPAFVHLGNPVHTVGLGLLGVNR